MDRYTIKLIYYDIQSTSEKAAIKNCLIAHDDSGEWVRYEDAAAHIEELELRIADESRACALFQSHITELERQLAAEKKRRMHYQHIVYNVCNMLDQIDGRRLGNGIVCGTAEEQYNDVEARIQQFITELDSLHQQLAADN